MTCGDFDDVAAELALGVLTGAERTSALQHLERCPTCRDQLAGLTEVGEALLQVVRPATPPPGFGARVAASLASHGSSTAPRRRPASWLAAAAVVALAVAAGWIGATATRPSSPGQLRRAELTADHRVAGHVFVYSGHPSWVYMSVDAGWRDADVTCLVTSAGGAVTRLGSFTLLDGYGYWGAPIPAGSGRVVSVRVVTAGGLVLAAAVVPAR